MSPLICYSRLVKDHRSQFRHERPSRTSLFCRPNGYFPLDQCHPLSAAHSDILEFGVPCEIVTKKPPIWKICTTKNVSYQVPKVVLPSPKCIVTNGRHDWSNCHAAAAAPFDRSHFLPRSLTDEGAPMRKMCPIVTVRHGRNGINLARKIDGWLGPSFTLLAN